MLSHTRVHACTHIHTHTHTSLTAGGLAKNTVVMVCLQTLPGVEMLAHLNPSHVSLYVCVCVLTVHMKPGFMLNQLLYCSYGSDESPVRISSLISPVSM